MNTFALFWKSKTALSLAIVLTVLQLLGLIGINAYPGAAAFIAESAGKIYICPPTAINPVDCWLVVRASMVQAVELLKMWGNFIFLPGTASTSLWGFWIIRDRNGTKNGELSED